MGSAGNFAVALAIIALSVQLTISGNFLVWLGIPYDVEGGMLLVKIHPGTYIAALAMLARLAAWWQMPGRAAQRVWRLPDLSLFFACIMFCVLCAASLTGAGGLITLIDTFLPAGMLGFALADATPAQLARLRRVLRGLLFLNAILALAEASAETQLIPSTLDALSPTADFRPTAFYDHPLTGAAATMIGLMLRGERNSKTWSLCYDATLFTALLTFGGRAALFIFTIATCSLHGRRLALVGLRHQLRVRDLLPTAAVLLCCVPLAVAALASGMADRLVAHLYWDPSAQVRIDQFRILGRLSTEQIVLGCRRADLASLVEPLRLGFRVGAIENFWLLMFLTLGALCFPIFLVGMAALVRFLWRVSGPRGRLMIVALLLVASTSNSLGRKSTLLTLLIGCVAASGYGWRCIPAMQARRQANMADFRFA